MCARVAHFFSGVTHVLLSCILYPCQQYGWTALHLAAQEGKVGVVRLLTEARAQVNIQTKVYVIMLLLQ